jgi:hypothetical protein
MSAGWYALEVVIELQWPWQIDTWKILQKYKLMPLVV